MTDLQGVATYLVVKSLGKNPPAGDISIFTDDGYAIFRRNGRGTVIADNTSTQPYKGGRWDDISKILDRQGLVGIVIQSETLRKDFSANGTLTDGLYERSKDKRLYEVY